MAFEGGDDRHLRQRCAPPILLRSLRVAASEEIELAGAACGDSPESETQVTHNVYALGLLGCLMRNQEVAD